MQCSFVTDIHQIFAYSSYYQHVQARRVKCDQLVVCILLLCVCVYKKYCNLAS